MRELIIDLSKKINNISLSADTDIYGLLIPVNNSKIKNRFNITFKKSGIVSRINIKIVLLGASGVEFEPNIVVTKGIKDIDCDLKIECLTNTDLSKLKITPSMEVSNPFIKTKHSLTISTFNVDQMNYLSSRGLSNKVSQKLLIEGFIGDIINKTNKEIL